MCQGPGKAGLDDPRQSGFRFSPGGDGDRPPMRRPAIGVAGPPCGPVTAAWAGPAFQFPAMAKIASAGNGRSPTCSAASSRSASSPPGSPS